MKIILFLALVGSIQCAFKDHAKRMYIASGMNTQWLDTVPAYKQTILDQYTGFTPGNQLKADTTEPQQNKFNFAAGDEIARFAAQHNLLYRGHTLVWHNQTPKWMSSLTGNALLDAMKNHITTEVSHFKGKIFAWDVCNEVLAEDGNLRQSFWLSAGKEYIATAFRTAHAADPNAKLYINDYNVEGVNAKSNGYYKLVKELLAEGVPIHGVGFQSHFTVGSIPKDYQANMQRFADLGLDVAVTELDIGMGGHTVQEQAEAFGYVVKACANIKRCVGVTIFAVGDKDSWRSKESPTPFDNNYKIKPAIATAIEQALV